MRTVALIIFPLYGWLLFFSSTCLTWSKDLPALQEQRHRDGSNTSVLVHSSETGAASNGRPCELCDTYVIPYPLSTGPNCGEPMYCKFKCNATYGKVSFMMHGRECEVTNNIDAKARRFSIKVEGLNYCDPNYGREPLDFPFTVTNWCFGGKDSQEIEVTWQQLPPESPIQGGPTSAKHSTTRLLLVLVVTIASMVFLACAIIFAYVWRKKIAHKQDKRSVQRMQEGVYDSKRHGEGLIGLQEKDSERVEVPCFNFETILAATDNFSDANKLGRGGYGPVYKGRLAGGQDIAVKRLSSVSTQGLQEFKNEVVLIAKLQHRNLVRLQGYCIKDDEKILLYEYMPNKSLDSFLFDPTRAQLLDWQSRSEIILGVARGLLYLHQDSRLRVIHRDLKASNILLDEEMNPKISDFGLARIFRGKEIEANTNRIVGTYGYMAPEYALEGLFSLKSDVFSFGIVLLEIISGKKNTGFYQSQQASSLLAYAWRLWTENKLQDLIDPCLDETCNANQFMRYANVGLLCVQNEPNDRPTMSNVVIMLDSEIATLPTPKQPAFFSSKGFTGTVLSSSKPETNLKIESSYLEGR